MTELKTAAVTITDFQHDCSNGFSHTSFPVIESRCAMRIDFILAQAKAVLV
jgi:hypothetical protein